MQVCEVITICTMMGAFCRRRHCCDVARKPLHWLNLSYVLKDVGRIFPRKCLNLYWNAGIAASIAGF